MNCTHEKGDTIDMNGAIPGFRIIWCNKCGAINDERDREGWTQPEATR